MRTIKSKVNIVIPPVDTPLEMPVKVNFTLHKGQEETYWQMGTPDEVEIFNVQSPWDDDIESYLDQTILDRLCEEALASL